MIEQRGGGLCSGAASRGELFEMRGAEWRARWRTLVLFAVRKSNVVEPGQARPSQDPRIATEIRGMLRSGVSCGAYAPRASPSAFLHVYMQRSGSGPGFPTRAE